MIQFVEFRRGQSITCICASRAASASASVTVATRGPGRGARSANEHRRSGSGGGGGGRTRNRKLPEAPSTAGRCETGMGHGFRPPRRRRRIRRSERLKMLSDSRGCREISPGTNAARWQSWLHADEDEIRKLARELSKKTKKCKEILKIFIIQRTF